MDVNKVVFGNFSIGAQKGEAKKSEKREETDKASVVVKQRILIRKLCLML